jgi:hypothetical protein
MSAIAPVTGSGHLLHPSPVKSTPYPTPPPTMITGSDANNSPGVDVKA